MNTGIKMLFLLVLLAGKLHAQTPAEQLSLKIAQKMKDTLSLTEQQKNQLYATNMAIHHQKMLVRQQHTITDSIRVRTQKIENTRDSLYRPILTEPKYQLYLQKKKQLISNN